ncbi:VOC family protein [Membranihabitans marinus]|uniref:VOC family protein n=1 Tax=Membranihabitans marinus TaxID=1227546 RepID=UPI001F26FC95|nr:VOC family protein [Membranihabitans marinus]
MKIEHFALNVPEPLALVQWYVAHLGLSVQSSMDSPPYMHFLMDDSGQVMVEVYRRTDADILDFNELNPLTVHLAFVSDDPSADKERLLNAGATEISDDVLADGSRLVMLKDPWGVALQLCKRAVPKIV